MRMKPPSIRLPHSIGRGQNAAINHGLIPEAGVTLKKSLEPQRLQRLNSYGGTRKSISTSPLTCDFFRRISSRRSTEGGNEFI